MAPTTTPSSAAKLCSTCGTRPRAIVKRSGGRRARLPVCRICWRDARKAAKISPREQVPDVLSTALVHDSPGAPANNYCNANRKQNRGPCTRPAGWGTDHAGYGRCKLHGGKSPSGEKNGARLEAKAHAIVMGAPVDIEPIDALVWCVRIAAGEVSYANLMVASLTPDEAKGPSVSTKRRPLSYGKDGESTTEHVEEITYGPPALHVWIKVRQEAVASLAKYSKMALDAGVAERQVQLAERYGELIGRVIGNILDGLRLNAEQLRRAPELVRRELTAIEGTATEVA